MINYFEGQTVEWLLERRTALQDALAMPGGTQTHVGIAPGIFHEFEGMSQAQLEEQYKRIQYALWVLDPDAYDNPYTQKVMKVCSIYPCSY